MKAPIRTYKIYKCLKCGTVHRNPHRGFLYKYFYGEVKNCRLCRKEENETRESGIPIAKATQAGDSGTVESKDTCSHLWRSRLRQDDIGI